MSKKLSIVMLAASLCANAYADEQSLEQRVSALESENERFTFSGALEIEASYTDPDSGNSSSDLVVATAELGAEAVIAENLSATLTLLYEEDDTDLEVDVAVLTYTQGPLTFVLGQDYMPFGNYSTALVNDPLAIDFGEARETALVARYENGPLLGAIYLFNGDQDEDGRDRINNFGLRIGFSGDGFKVGADYISNLADSDGLQDNDYGYATGVDAVDGSSLYGELELGAVQIFAEYLTALDELGVDGNNSEPSAAQLEVALTSGNFTYALSYQQTDEALFLDLPEERVSVGMSTEVLGGLGLGVELTFDEDYSVSDGGTGDSTNSLVLQLSAEF